jgi:hypothetical protein
MSRESIDYHNGTDRVKFDRALMVKLFAVAPTELELSVLATLLGRIIDPMTVEVDDEGFVDVTDFANFRDGEYNKLVSGIRYDPMTELPDDAFVTSLRAVMRERMARDLRIMIAALLHQHEGIDFETAMQTVRDQELTDLSRKFYTAQLLDQHILNAVSLVTTNSGDIDPQGLRNQVAWHAIMEYVNANLSTHPEVLAKLMSK